MTMGCLDKEPGMEVLGDSNEGKILVAKYSTVYFSAGSTKVRFEPQAAIKRFKSNRTGIEPELNGNRTRIERESNVN